MAAHFIQHALREVRHGLVHDAEDLGQSRLVLVLEAVEARRGQRNNICGHLLTAALHSKYFKHFSSQWYKIYKIALLIHCKN